MRGDLRADVLAGLEGAWVGKGACMVCNGSPRGVSYDLLWNLTMWIDEIIAVDSGLHWLEKAGITPELIVGDLDSVDRALYDRSMAMGVSSVVADRMKDETDLELALISAQDMFKDKVVVVNFSGGYIDYEISTLGAMGRCPLPAFALDDHMAVAFLEGPAKGLAVDDARLDFGAPGSTKPARLRLSQLGLAEGDRYSVIAYDGPAVVTQVGVRWPQDSFEYGGMDGRGVANVVESSDAQVSVERGRAMVIIDF